MQTIKERIEYIMKSKGLNYNTLIGEDEIVKKDALRISISRGDKKSLYYIKLISNKHDISEQWILTGKGEVSSNKSEFKESTDLINYKTLYHKELKNIEQRDKMIAMLEKENSNLKECLEENNSELDTLKKENTRLLSLSSLAKNK